MKTWTAFSVPTVLLCSVVGVLGFYPGIASWRNHATLHCLPYLLLAVTAVLGCLFAQARISMMCAMLASATYLVDRFAFTTPNPARAISSLFLVSIYVPTLTVVFHHLHEQGSSGFRGLLRATAILGAGLAVFLLPLDKGFALAVAESRHILVRPVSRLFPVPLIGIAVLAVACALLLVRRRGASPATGPLLCLALVAVFISLTFRSPAWQTRTAQVVFMVCMSCGALILTWVILETMWRSAAIDELTELPGRQSLRRHYARLSGDYTIAVVDVDNFKKINDTYGHGTGDQVLRYVASQLKKHAGGVAYRYGGEEFVMVRDNVKLADALPAFEELRADIAAKRFILRGPDRPRKKPKGDRPGNTSSRTRPARAIKVTVSIGVAHSTPSRTVPEDVQHAADKAMYRAKRDGRNRVRS